jgi:hypothetical protein
VTHIWNHSDERLNEHMILRVGRYEDGRIGEVFIDYTDPRMMRNERAKNFGHDIATIISIALQYGAPLDVLRNAVGRGELPWLGKMIEYPHTPIGTVLDALWAESQPRGEESTS